MRDLIKNLSFIIFIFFLATCQTKMDIPNQTADLFLDAKAELGEGAIWHPTQHLLYWVDIENGILHILDPATGDDKEFEVGQRIGTVVPIDTGGVLVALQHGIFQMDPGSDTLTSLGDPESDKDNTRFNDGKCSPEGRFWAGTMALDAEGTEGALYRLNQDGSIDRVIENVGVSNGIAWSLDGKIMYYIDTPTHEVRAFDYDQSSGDITNGRAVITFPEGMGVPDGMTIDSEGMLWVAMWRGSMVGRWDPETGELIHRIEVPALNVTACAFGGRGLKTLFITTARVGLSEEQLTEFPLSGAVFAVEPGVSGVPAFFFKSK